MGTTLTKSIATRIPFDEYVRILQIATEMKVSMSDYIILKLHAADENGPLKNQVQSLQNDLSTIRKELDKTKKSNAEYGGHIGQWKAHSDGQGEQLKIVQTQVSQLQSELDKCRKEGAIKQAKLTELEKQFKAKHDQAITSNSILESTLAVGESQKSRVEMQRVEIAKLTKSLSDVNIRLGSKEVEVGKLIKSLNDANASLKQVTADRQGIIDGAKAMYAAIIKEHDASRINFIPKSYWPMIDGFISSLK